MPLHLSPEEKQLGTDNFNEAVGLTRRKFLKGVAAGTPALGGAYFGYEALKGNPVRVGWIGTGDEGSVLLTQHPPEYLEIVAIADLRPSNRERAFKGDGNEHRVGLHKKLGKPACEKIKVYENHKELLADPKVEMVVIAVPLSQHAPIAIEAMKAGKHVLCEKLMAHNIAECKEMIKVQRETGMLLSVGHQRHYSVLYDNANELVKKGLLGDIKFIRAQWHRNNSFPGRDSWRKYPKGTPQIDKDALGKADLKNFGYNDLQQLVDWRLYNETGGGLMAELGSHQLDAASIFLGKVKPLAVSGYGGKNFYGVKGVGSKDKQEDNREIDDHVYVTIEFPGKYYYERDEAGKIAEKDGKQLVASPDDIVIVTYSSINTNRLEPYGETVFGSRGTLMMVEEKESLLFKEASPTTGGGGPAQRLHVINDGAGAPVLDASASLAPSAAAASAQGTNTDVSRGYTEEMEHFAFCVRNELPVEELRCNGVVAMADAIMALTSNIAMRKRQRIEFKRDWFDPDKEATPEKDTA
ncbi:MAG: Gfo/Idh/MocA family oxidoreductase [Planctomycetota bacterium]|nr:Gfo/Idh/MocA family oxidoreductase [Planctomycetota bacterium]MDA1247985.1 Gfo/Idh/MocA family oxidoreductase [Planctomycetota bacterium]